MFPVAPITVIVSPLTYPLPGSVIVKLVISPGPVTPVTFIIKPLPKPPVVPYEPVVYDKPGFTKVALVPTTPSPLEGVADPVALVKGKMLELFTAEDKSAVAKIAPEV